MRPNSKRHVTEGVLGKMSKHWRLRSIAFSLLCGVALSVATGIARAQSTVSSQPVQLWVDTRTGQVFIRPGAHRVRLNMPGMISEDQLNREVEEKVQEKTQSMQSEIT